MKLKNRFLITLLLLCICFCFNTVIVKAESIDNFYVNRSNGYITGYRGTPPSNLVIPINDNIRGIADGAFSGESITSVTFQNPNKYFTYIGAEAFKNCNGLSSIELPMYITTIGESAFEGCRNLQSITKGSYLGKGITTISDKAFYDCYALKTVRLSSSPTKIGNYAFANCFVLSNIYLPSSVTTIGNYAYKSTNISSVDLSNITSLGQNVFESCSKLTTVNMSNMLASIPNNTFKGCSSLTSINIPSNIKSIGDSAFINSGLNSMTWNPSALATIGDNAFDNCKFTSFNVPNNVTSLGSNVFNNCDNITYISLSSTVNSVGTDLCSKKLDYVLNNSSVTLTSSHAGDTLVIKESGSNKNFSKTFENNTITLSNTSYIYDGSACKPTVTVKNANGNSLNSSYYTISYSNNTTVGTATVKITPKAPFTTNTVTKTFTINNIPPSITRQPNDITTKLGYNITFTVDADGTNNKYQWYMSTSETSAGSKIVGETETTYTISADALTYDLDGSYYYCVVSNDGNASVTSRRAKLTINAKPTNPTFLLNMQESTWVTKEFTISIIGSKIVDSTDEVGYKYSIDGGLSWEKYTDMIVWNTDTRSTTIYAYAYNTDYPSIKSETVTLAFSYDGTSPIINSVKIKNYKATIKATDAISGINAYSIIDTETDNVIAEQTATSTSTTFPIDTLGTYVAMVTDKAGNIAYSEPFIVNQNPATCEHDEDKVELYKEESCCEDGYSGDKYCSKCNTLQEKGTIIKATKEHVIEIHDKKDATCALDGYTGDDYCSISDKLIAKGIIIEKTGNHEYDMTNGTITKEATTESEGTIEYKCKNCDDVLIESIEKLPEEEIEEEVDNSIEEDIEDENNILQEQINEATNKKAVINKLSNTKGKKLTISLKKAKDYSFEIKVSTNKKFKKSVKTYKTSKTSYTIKKLKKNKKYYVKVRTYKKIDGKTYYGKWCSIKSVKIKK